MNRGDICIANVDKRRPVVIVSSSEMLSLDIWQVHLVPITTSRSSGKRSTSVPLLIEELRRDSLASCLDLFLGTRLMLSEPLTSVGLVELRQIDEMLTDVLGINLS